MKIINGKQTGEVSFDFAGRETPTPNLFNGLIP